MKATVRLQLCQGSMLPVFFILAILMGMEWYLTVVIFCISRWLMTFNGLVDICNTSFMRCLFSLLAIFLLGYSYYWLLEDLSIVKTWVLCQMYIWWMLFPICRLSIHFLNRFFDEQTFWNFWSAIWPFKKMVCTWALPKKSLPTAMAKIFS